MDVLATPRLELRLRAAPRPRAGRRLHRRGRRRDRRAPGVRREHERPANDLPRRARGDFELIDFAPRFQLYDRYFKPPMLVRILRPLSGEPRARVRCRPVYEYGLEQIAALARVEPHRVHRLPDARPPDDEPPAHVRRGPAPVPARARPAPRAHLGRAARSRPRGHGRALPRADARLLAALGEGDARPARLPAGGRPLGARAEAPPVRGHGRAPGRDDDEPSRAPGLGTHLGLPLLLAARRVLHAERARAPRALRGDGALPRVPPQPVRGERGRAPAGVPHQRRLGGARARARAPLRLQRRRPGARRQPGVRARPERRLRRDGARVSRLFLDTRFVGEVPPRHGGRHGRRRSSTRSTRASTSPMPASGSSAGRRGCTASPCSCTGRARAGRSRSPRPSAPPSWRHARERSRSARAELLETRCWNDEVGALTQVAGEPQLDAALSSPSTSAIFAPDDPRAASPRRRDPRGAVRGRRPAPPLHGRPTTSATWRRRSPSARSGSSRRSRSSAEPTRRGSSSTGSLSLDNGLGLYSEDILPDTLEQSGNFPQTYSHVGLINAAFRLSRRWD